MTKKLQQIRSAVIFILIKTASVTFLFFAYNAIGEWNVGRWPVEGLSFLGLLLAIPLILFLLTSPFIFTYIGYLEVKLNRKFNTNTMSMSGTTVISTLVASILIGIVTNIMTPGLVAQIYIPNYITIPPIAFFGLLFTGYVGMLVANRKRNK